MGHSPVELYFSCRELVNMDVGSLSDAFLVVSLKTQSGWIKLAQTEIVWNNLNPDFAKSIEMDFLFERRQTIKVECRDADNNSGTQYDNLGSTEFELGALIGSRNQTMVLNLMEGKKKMGKLVVRAESRKSGAAGSTNELAILSFEAENLPGGFLCMNEKSFFVVKKLLRKHNQPAHGAKDERTKLLTNQFEEEWVKVYESELSRGGSKHKYADLTATISKLSSGDPTTPLKVDNSFITVHFVWFNYVLQS